MQKTGNVVNNLYKTKWMYQKQTKLDVDDLLLTILSLPIIPVLTGVERPGVLQQTKTKPP